MEQRWIWAMTVLLAACVPDGATGPVGGAVVEASAAATQTCGLAGSFAHPTRNEGTKTVLTGGGALAYRSDYAVNTDGARNSYHPDDPFGREGLAINTICNGADAVTADGVRHDYRACRALVDTFRKARAEGWTAPGGARMRFYAMATEDQQRHVPCLQPDGAFVSTTSLVADPGQGKCNAARYLDANSVNFIIRPGRQAFATAGMQLGDLAVVMDPRSGRTVFAVVGDTGPATGLGEGSVAVGQRLAGRTSLPRTRAETYAYAMRDIVTVVLPGEPMGAPFTQTRIDAAGALALASFGGIGRVKGCATAAE